MRHLRTICLPGSAQVRMGLMQAPSHHSSWLCSCTPLCCPCCGRRLMEIEEDEEDDADSLDAQLAELDGGFDSSYESDMENMLAAY